MRSTICGALVVLRLRIGAVDGRCTRCPFDQSERSRRSSLGACSGLRSAMKISSSAQPKFDGEQCPRDASSCKERPRFLLGLPYDRSFEEQQYAPNEQQQEKNDSFWGNFLHIPSSRLAVAHTIQRIGLFVNHRGQKNLERGRDPDLRHAYPVSILRKYFTVKSVTVSD